MKNKIITNMLIMIGLLISINTYAVDLPSNSQATASISPSCRVKVDNMIFGNVSIQSISGNGDVFSNTTLSLLCTKDQSVTLSSNMGSNGTAASSTFNLSNGLLQRTATGNFTNYYNASQGDINNLATLYGANSGIYNFTSSSQIKYISACNCNFRMVYPDGSLIPVGAKPIGQAYMASGTNKVAYQISIDNNTYTPISQTAGSPINYTQNNGDWQDYTLYGKANVKQAVPGVYVDINTLTVNF